MSSPIILHVPHASRLIPAHARTGIVLTDPDLEHELDCMTDSFTDVIAQRAVHTVVASGTSAPAVVQAPVSRLVVDVERFTDGSEPMEEVGMGAIYTKTHDRRRLPEHVDNELLGRYFRPHARDIECAVGEALAEHHRVVIIDVHSYPTRHLPYELAAQDAPRPSICLGTDTAHTPPWLVSAAHEAFGAFELAFDSPSAGTYVPLRFYGTDARVSSIMIEVRRDQHMDERTISPHGRLARVADALADLVSLAHQGGA